LPEASSDNATGNSSDSTSDNTVAGS
jgi:hypothetical protein